MKVSVQLQNEAEMDIWEEQLSDQLWSKRITDDIVKVVELCHRQNGHIGFCLVICGPHGGCREWWLQRKGKLALQEGAATRTGPTLSVPAEQRDDPRDKMWELGTGTCTAQYLVEEAQVRIQHPRQLLRAHGRQTR